MGRGRAKAKQTRVARKLKYTSPDTDFASLERELSCSRNSTEENFDPYNDDYYEDSYDSYKQA